MRPQDELVQILEFAQRHPSACFHVVDLPYRLCSPAAQDPDNVRLWLDSDGVVTGFGIIQRPFATLDWAVHPGQPALASEILCWAVERLQHIADAQGEGFGFLVDSAQEADPTPMQFGFVLDDWHMRHLIRGMEVPLAPVALPPGFMLRPLYGAAEVESYVALHRAAFNSRNMTEDWRARTLAHPAYSADFDLVAEDGDHRLVAFCIGWLSEVQGQRLGHIEPLGVAPAYQKMGLGRAILCENLRRMADVGAESVFIDAESDNPSSQRLYESLGFRDAARVIKYFRRFEPAQADGKG